MSENPDNKLPVPKTLCASKVVDFFEKVLIQLAERGELAIGSPPDHSEDWKKGEQPDD